MGFFLVFLFFDFFVFPFIYLLYILIAGFPLLSPTPSPSIVRGGGVSLHPGSSILYRNRPHPLPLRLTAPCSFLQTECILCQKLCEWIGVLTTTGAPAWLQVLCSYCSGSQPKLFPFTPGSLSHPRSLASPRDANPHQPLISHHSPGHPSCFTQHLVLSTTISTLPHPHLPFPI